MSDLSFVEQQDLISRAMQNTHGHDWEYLGYSVDCEYLGLAHFRSRNGGKWVWLRCRTCESKLAAQRFEEKAHRGWTMRWQDNGGQFHEVWLTPSCEEVMLDCLKPVMES